ncbi:hypothetical protein DEU56DRAFT_757389 [Suillus clintonianus]|uniref:uncharacterized protein n=1 Tax=Suillus clintonianus TaxID=1904413 RepID=UPI001B85E24A|nr:uncharacterized protein DEU56DRAFT_757389 [Suillus clintonianus]KAG2132036.1 hypothetical protein DEU56DRAFT_757389 [Suillus clintonianus]
MIKVPSPEMAHAFKPTATTLHPLSEQPRALLWYKGQESPYAACYSKYTFNEESQDSKRPVSTTNSNSKSEIPTLSVISSPKTPSSGSSRQYLTNFDNRYYEGGVVLLKKGSRDSIHVLETAECRRPVHYKLTFTVMWELVTTHNNKANENSVLGEPEKTVSEQGWKSSGEITLSGDRQSRIGCSSSHIMNTGKMVEK